MKALKIAALFFALGWSAIPAPGATLDELRGEQVGWARLKTPSPHWMRHGQSDPTLMRFLSENTTLNLDPAWHVADVESLDAMCRYPLLFSQSLEDLQSPNSRRNVIEYLRRGGFLLIDACINNSVTPDPRQFLIHHQLFFAETLPEARVVPLAPDHEIFRCFYRIGQFPHTEDGGNWPAMGLYGILIGDRLAGVISFGGLQCGWDGMKADPSQPLKSMRMLVNIYIYAMLRGQ